MNTKRNFTHCYSNWTMNIFNRNFDRFYSDFFLIRIVVEVCFFFNSEIEWEEEKEKMRSNCCFHSHSHQLNVNESDSIQFDPWSAHILELAKADDDRTMCLCMCVCDNQVLFIMEQLSFFFFCLKLYYYDDEQKMMISSMTRLISRHRSSTMDSNWKQSRKAPENESKIKCVIHQQFLIRFHSLVD